ncbi:MAG TPA: hypothetical protein VE823_08795 [Geodermatophilus sp.]|nr:hypothetical protein [Geodermatophilus sp.]
MSGRPTPSGPLATVRAATLSIGIGTAALFAPRALPRLLGASETGTREDVLLPLRVRLAAARNIAMGAALLVTPAPQAAAPPR